MGDIGQVFFSEGRGREATTELINAFTRGQFAANNDRALYGACGDIVDP